jgi:hypothetical protein
MGTSIRKTRFDRNPRQLYAIGLKLKGMSYSQIGRAMGVTSQRAQQLVMVGPSVKESVRIRAKGKCADCQAYIPSVFEDGYGSITGHVHHDRLTETPEEYCKMENLVYLCISCHAKRHH